MVQSCCRLCHGIRRAVAIRAPSAALTTDSGRLPLVPHAFLGEGSSRTLNAVSWKKKKKKKKKKTKHQKKKNKTNKKKKETNKKKKNNKKKKKKKKQKKNNKKKKNNIKNK
eukprot:NODE_16957_length_968_cov_5.841855.p4 GENE.NODE_16957_length_968_cov_5.841855~~NODE_16957_length_968_cov_5.841855.p4  ORF type:complete len:111 (+),score=74.32 NODE_16957_length_968_cov_5.841855:628-960(+)